MVSSVTRDPWGNRVLLAGGDPLDLGYPGQWRDPATGLFQNHHRDYDPMTGRYIEADPLGLGGGSNLYGYVGGDPINTVDPDGRSAARYIFPMLTAALVDVNGQLLENGGRLDCVDFTKVGVSAAMGGFGAGWVRGWVKLTPGSMKWANVSRRIRRKEGLTGHPIDLHHWAVPRRMYEKLSNPKLKELAESILNRPWNLNIVPRAIHQQKLHRGRFMQDLWVGAPRPALGMLALGSTRLSMELHDMARESD